MKTIIVPTDFSPVSINALHYAINMAKEIKAKLLLFHTYQIPVTFSEVPVITVSLDQLARESEERLAQLKKDVEHIVSGEVEVESQNLMGDVIEELSQLCEKTEPFAVVMGTKGAGAIERLIIGSNTLFAMKRLTVPLIIVPPGAVYKPIHNIGFASDFKDVKDTTPVDDIATLMKTFNAKLHVLNVDYKEKNFGTETTIEVTALHELLEPLHPGYHYIEHPDIEEGINAFADANKIDVLLTVPKKHKFLENIFRKSRSEDLVLHSHLPIIAVHA